MFNPPRCPIEWCGAVSTKDEPFFQRWGSYAVMCKGCRIPRFRCRECKRTFSTQTFRMDYREKRPDLNVEIVKRFCSRAGLRQTSFVLRISLKTVIKKLKKIGEHLGRLHEHLMGKFQSGRSFQLDELETFETDRIERPVTMPVLIERRTFFIVGSLAGTLPPRRIKKRTKAKPAKRALDLIQLKERKNESSKVVRAVLERLRAHLSPGARLTLETDQKKTYPKIAREVFESFDLRHLAFPGSKPKTNRNPLFRINLTLGMLRDGMSRLTRRSWLVSKIKENLDHHANFYIVYRNYHRMLTNEVMMPPAVALGFLPRRLEWDEMVGWNPAKGVPLMDRSFVV